MDDLLKKGPEKDELDRAVKDWCLDCGQAFLKRVKPAFDRHFNRQNPIWPQRG